MTQIGFSESGESVGAVRAHDARSESEESMHGARGFSESGESVGAVRALDARCRAGPASTLGDRIGMRASRKHLRSGSVH